ncbi:hypothetical protein B0I37DRAFT_353045 [Chaetomium sp. MPI-CAGE-AT-0009]|nr:hypothetical protein B0I37DRAFT_353045 [Chaetomium sp. MPI-CAGE-AT-0009]
MSTLDLAIRVFHTLTLATSKIPYWTQEEFGWPASTYHSPLLTSKKLDPVVVFPTQTRCLERTQTHSQFYITPGHPLTRWAPQMSILVPGFDSDGIKTWITPESHALLFANIEPQYQSIAAATHSMMFFGTPHFSTDKSSSFAIATAFKPIVKAKTGGPGTRGRASRLVKMITRSTHKLAMLNDDFSQLAPRYEIKTLYETLPWKNTTKPIVGRMDAIELPSGCFSLDSVNRLVFKHPLP